MYTTQYTRVACKDTNCRFVNLVNIIVLSFEPSKSHENAIINSYYITKEASKIYSTLLYPLELNSQSVNFRIMYSRGQKKLGQVLLRNLTKIELSKPGLLLKFE
jgi:hypothetical protein